MTDIKKIFEQAKEEYESEISTRPLNKALSDLIQIERKYYYNKGTTQARLKDIREIVFKYSQKS